MNDSLFDQSLYDGLPPHERASDTSQAAAISMIPRIGTLRRRVYDAIAEVGEHGITDDALETRLGLRHQTVSARRRELVLLGLLRRVGERRTSSGRLAAVWTIRTGD